MKNAMKNKIATTMRNNSEATKKRKNDITTTMRRGASQITKSTCRTKPAESTKTQ
jgi:hypothetical protein